MHSELEQLKASTAKAAEAGQQLQEKDSVIENLNKELDALKAKLSALDRY